MKKVIYIFLTIILGIILSFLMHAIIEIIYLEYSELKNLKVSWNTELGASCALPGVVQIFILFFGIIGRYFLGQYWWRIIYIEKRYKRIK